MMRAVVLVTGGLVTIGIIDKAWSWAGRKLRALVERRERDEERKHIERLWQRATPEMAVLQRIGGLPKGARRQLLIERGGEQPKDEDRSSDQPSVEQ